MRFLTGDLATLSSSNVWLRRVLNRLLNWPGMPTPLGPTNGWIFPCILGWNVFLTCDS